jgi:hypothetical protein
MTQERDVGYTATLGLSKDTKAKHYGLESRH